MEIMKNTAIRRIRARCATCDSDIEDISFRKGQKCDLVIMVECHGEDDAVGDEGLDKQLRDVVANDEIITMEFFHPGSSGVFYSYRKANDIDRMAWKNTDWPK